MKIMSATFCCLCCLYCTALLAQTTLPAFEVPTTNPKAVIQQRVAATTIEVAYNRPSVRGRKIFGDLVPYGKIWRTGSDAATSITFSTPVILNGFPTDAGKYELFTIPGKDEWVIILQKARGQWGSYAYDSSYDVVRFQVKPVRTDYLTETFSISIDDITLKEAILHITWEKVRVPVMIEIDLASTVIPPLEEALSAEGKRPYFLAAMFYFENNLDIDRAAELMNLAIEERPGHIGMLYRLALILERKGDYEGAKAAAERSLKEATAAGDELRTEYTKLNTTLLERLSQH